MRTMLHIFSLCRTYNLLDGQVELILKSLELYGYNLEFILNTFVSLTFMYTY